MKSKLNGLVFVHVLEYSGALKLDKATCEGGRRWSISKTKECNNLLAVHTENSEKNKRAQEFFVVAGAEGIRTTGHASMPEDMQVRRGTEYLPRPVYSICGVSCR